MSLQEVSCFLTVSHSNLKRLPRTFRMLLTRLESCQTIRNLKFMPCSSRVPLETSTQRDLACLTSRERLSGTPGTERRECPRRMLCKNTLTWPKLSSLEVLLRIFVNTLTGTHQRNQWRYQLPQERGSDVEEWEGIPWKCACSQSSRSP